MAVKKAVGMMTMYRLNYRNEAVTLRALLKVACALLHRNSIVMPYALDQWYLAQRNLTQLRRGKPKPVHTDITVDSVQQAIMRGDVE